MVVSQEKAEEWIGSSLEEMPEEMLALFIGYEPCPECEERAVFLGLDGVNYCCYVCETEIPHTDVEIVEGFEDKTTEDHSKCFVAAKYRSRR